MLTIVKTLESYNNKTDIDVREKKNASLQDPFFLL